MKKLVIAIALFGFIAFGIVGIQHVNAASVSIELTQSDDDKNAKKDDKKSSESKEASAKSDANCGDQKASTGCSSKPSSCCPKEGAAKDCSDKK
jgi:hypothetical protein